jgi:hypothetical protein
MAQAVVDDCVIVIHVGMFSLADYDVHVEEHRQSERHEGASKKAVRETVLC